MLEIAIDKDRSPIGLCNHLPDIPQFCFHVFNTDFCLVLLLVLEHAKQLETKLTLGKETSHLISK